jgi:uncharacterized membrane protein
LAFSNTTQAAEAQQRFKQLDAAQVLRLVNTAVIVRDVKGNVAIHEQGDLSPLAKRAIISMAGLVGFGVGVLWRGIRTGLLGAFLAGQTGAILMTTFDPGFSNLYLEHLAQDVAAGTSLLVASVEFKSESLAAVVQSRFAEARIIRPVTPLTASQVFVGS